MTPILSAALLLLVAACSAERAPTEDAGPSAVCRVAPSYGDVGKIPPERSLAVRRDDDSGDAMSITYIAGLNSDQDQVLIQLYKGFGVFTSKSILAGSYVLAGEELNYATCGACVRMFADRPFGGGIALQDLMATAGTLTIAEVGPAGSGAFKATLSGVAFEHVNIDATFTSMPVDDGCETSISRLVADVPMSAAL
jgi:hypothetical protein